MYSPTRAAYKVVKKTLIRLTLALSTSRPCNQACYHGWDPFIWVLLPDVLPPHPPTLASPDLSHWTLVLTLVSFYPYKKLFLKE